MGIWSRIKKAAKTVVSKVTKPKPKPSYTFTVPSGAMTPTKTKTYTEYAAATGQTIAAPTRRGRGRAPTPPSPAVQGALGITPAPTPRTAVREVLAPRRAVAPTPTPSAVYAYEPRKPTDILEAGYRGATELGARIETKKARRKFTWRDYPYAVVAGLGTSVFGGGLAVKETVKKVPSAVRHPIVTTKKVPSLLGRTIVSAPRVAKKAAITVKKRPLFAAGYAVGEVAQMKAIGVVTKGVSKVGVRAITRASPKYKPVVKVGAKKVIKGTGIEIAPPVSKLKIPLRKQVGLAGKEVDIVSGARDLFGVVRKRKVKIAKPKAPGLERAFFGDPYKRLRVSRVGLGQKEAGISDILRGKITFKKAKPQAILFEKERIAKFPRGLKGVEKKLRLGKRLTAAEERRLTQWQLKPTKEFKAPGFISKEPEVTLAPGEIIKRKRVKAVTLIEGERVPIIEAKIAKPTVKTKKLLLKPKLTLKETKLLRKRLVRETGFRPSRIVKPSKPYVSPYRLGVSGIAGVSRVYRKKPVYKPYKFYKAPIIEPYRPLAYKPYKYKPSPYKPYKPSPIIAPSPFAKVSLLGLAPPVPKKKKKLQIWEKRKPIKKKKRKIPKQPLMYQPSLTAKVLRIQARKKPKKYKIGYLPGIRPIIPITKKRRKKPLVF